MAASAKQRKLYLGFCTYSKDGKIKGIRPPEMRVKLPPKYEKDKVYNCADGTTYQVHWFRMFFDGKTLHCRPIGERHG